LKLWRKLLYEVGVNITPGSACHCYQLGWFRLCFAFVDDKTMAVALERIRQFTAAAERDKQSRVRYP
jgi:aspartate/methionine/tyrosine aminotransferase